MIDFTRAYFDHTGGETEVRMPISSRIVITKPDSSVVTFYSIVGHRGEVTYPATDLFKDDSYSFEPVLGHPPYQDQMFLRIWADTEIPGPSGVRIGYRELVPLHAGWGVRVPIVPTVESEQLTTLSEIRDAMHSGKPLVGRIELPTVNGYAAVIDHPINSMALHVAGGNWQVNSGPVLLPTFDPVPSSPLAALEVAQVCYNRFDYAEFLQRGYLAIGGGKSVVGFNTPCIAKECAITLWAHN